MGTDFSRFLMKGVHAVVMVVEAEPTSGHVAGEAGGVIGAETGGITQDIQEPDEIYASVRHDSQDACSLEFSFSSSENDSKLIEGISFADLTDSFCRQTQWIAKVWGSCTPYSDQKSIAEFFRRFCCCAHFLLLF